MSKPKSSSTPASTQRYLEIQEIRDDVVVMRDGSLRSVLLVSSINFDLKSEEEQAAIIQSYTQFLNTLDFPLQIVIQSRKFNIDDYLNRLVAIEKKQTNELLRLQTVEYRQYIAELVELADLMSKRFYVVIPFQTHERKRQNFFQKVRSLIGPMNVLELRPDQFTAYKDELFKRVDRLIDGLMSVGGLKAAVLDTQGLIELYYQTYNPQTSEQQPMGAVSELNLA